MFNHPSCHNIRFRSHGSNQTVHVLYAIPSAQPADHPKLLSISLSNFSGICCAALPFAYNIHIPNFFQ